MLIMVNALFQCALAFISLCKSTHFSASVFLSSPVKVDTKINLVISAFEKNGISSASKFKVLAINETNTLFSLKVDLLPLKSDSFVPTAIVIRIIKLYSYQPHGSCLNH